jgi:hypothetical protein
MGTIRMINTALDRLVRPEIHFLSRSWSSFQVCGSTGLAFAFLLSMGLVLARGLSPWTMVAITLAASATFLALAMLTKVLTGEERLTYYYHMIVVLITTGLLLMLLRQPVLPYLDITLLGVGVFLAFGRVGCLMVGCCYGRPSSNGVCYRSEHAEAGFTGVVGARLLPIQAIESLWVGLIVLVGCAQVLDGAPAGTALAWYVMTYALGRFCFEFLRGDLERPYALGFSEAQWTSLAMTGLMGGLELTGQLPRHAWQIALAALILLAMVAIRFGRHRPLNHSVAE